MCPKKQTWYMLDIPIMRKMAWSVDPLLYRLRELNLLPTGRTMTRQQFERCLDTKNSAIITWAVQVWNRPLEFDQAVTVVCHCTDIHILRAQEHNIFGKNDMDLFWYLDEVHRSKVMSVPLLKLFSELEVQKKAQAEAKNKHYEPIDWKSYLWANKEVCEYLHKEKDIPIHLKLHWIHLFQIEAWGLILEKMAEYDAKDKPIPLPTCMSSAHDVMQLNITYDTSKAALDQFAQVWLRVTRDMGLKIEIATDALTLLWQRCPQIHDALLATPPLSHTMARDLACLSKRNDIVLPFILPPTNVPYARGRHDLRPYWLIELPIFTANEIQDIVNTTYDQFISSLHWEFWSRSDADPDRITFGPYIIVIDRHQVQVTPVQVFGMYSKWLEAPWCVETFTHILQTYGVYPDKIELFKQENEEFVAWWYASRANIPLDNYEELQLYVSSTNTNITALSLDEWSRKRQALEQRNAATQSLGHIRWRYFESRFRTFITWGKENRSLEDFLQYAEDDESAYENLKLVLNSDMIEHSPDGQDVNTNHGIIATTFIFQFEVVFDILEERYANQQRELRFSNPEGALVNVKGAHGCPSSASHVRKLLAAIPSDRFKQEWLEYWLRDCCKVPEVMNFLWTNYSSIAPALEPHGMCNDAYAAYLSRYQPRMFHRYRFEFPGPTCNYLRVCGYGS